jgi:hypothetical protein
MGIRIKESDSKIKKEISNRLSIEINKLIAKRKDKIVDKIKIMVADWIMSQPEIASLIDDGVPGSLNAQFGFPPGQAEEFVNLIILTVSESIQVKVRPLDKNLKGSVEFNIQPKTYNNLLSSHFAFIQTDKQPLHWLDWILNKGTQTIVFGYKYVPSDYGRSGGGHMQKGVVWRIPPEYAGVSGDNFITRAFTGREKELGAVLREVISK